MPATTRFGLVRPDRGTRTIPYRFSVKQYHRMIAAGVFSDADRCELLEGRVVRKVTHNPPHDAALTRLHRRLARLLSDDWLLRVQCAISTSESEPEPGIAVVRGPEDRYDRGHPASRDIALVVEVADSSLELDQTEKQRIYAKARIPVYWVVNLIDRRIEIYTLPGGRRTPVYQERQEFYDGDRAPVVLEGATIARLPVRELLP